MDKAAEASRGTLDGLLLASFTEDWSGHRDKALTLLEQAVNDYPKAIKAHDALVEALHRANRHEDAIRREAVGNQLIHTTCGPLLGLTWKKIREQGWPGRIKDLEQARATRPRRTPGPARTWPSHRQARRPRERRSSWRC